MNGKYLVLASFGICLAGEGFGKYKSFMVGLPIFSMGGESVTKVEYNLGGAGSLGLELTSIAEGEQFTDDEVIENNGDSLLMKGAEVGLTYSSYSNGGLMSGGYWSLGVGYRQVQAAWSRSPTDDFSPAGVSLDSGGRFKHDLISGGGTARARVGYRYVASSIPFALGAYIGIRHFQGRFQDRENDEAVEIPNSDNRSLTRRFMTSIEPGLELGMSF